MGTNDLVLLMSHSAMSLSPLRRNLKSLPGTIPRNKNSKLTLGGAAQFVPTVWLQAALAVLDAGWVGCADNSTPFRTHNIA